MTTPSSLDGVIKACYYDCFLSVLSGYTKHDRGGGSKVSPKCILRSGWTTTERRRNRLTYAIVYGAGHQVFYYQPAAVSTHTSPLSNLIPFGLTGKNILARLYNKL